VNFLAKNQIIEKSNEQTTSVKNFKRILGTLTDHMNKEREEFKEQKRINSDKIVHLTSQMTRISLEQHRSKNEHHLFKLRVANFIFEKSPEIFREFNIVFGNIEMPDSDEF
jgi:hypothetical protein